jgi:hypothetical protein
METKLATLRRLHGAGDVIGALKIAARFPVLGDDKAAITRGWEAAARPGLYAQMGRCPAALVMQGVLAMRRKYGLA